MMRPIELTLEGFTSFRTRQVLNFATLDLFAITGPTGAGKSSLLEAMTFALYGTTVKKSNTHELVSQGSSALKVSFEFLVRSIRYRITRTWRYRPRTPDVTALLEQKQGEKWIPLDTRASQIAKSVEQILGMDFDTFTRVILLPQGKFDEFLKGSPAKRRELLRHLAGFEIFERMREESNQRFKNFKRNRELIEQQLAALSPPNESELIHQQARLDSVEIQLPSMDQKVSQTEQALYIEEQLLIQLQRLQALQSTLTKLNLQLPEITRLSQQLEQAQTADRIKGEWAEVQSARKQSSTAEARYLAAEQRLQKAQITQGQEAIKLQAAHAEVMNREPGLKAREHALISAQHYEEQRLTLSADLQRNRAGLTPITQALAAAQRSLEQATRAASQAQQDYQTSEQALIQQPSVEIELARLNEIAPGLNQMLSLARKYQTDQHKLQQIQGQSQTLTIQLEQAQSQLHILETQIQTAQAALDTAQQTNDRATRHDHAAQLRQAHQPGEPCPVCGSTIPAELPPLALINLEDLIPLRKELSQVEKNRQMAHTALIRLQGESAQVNRNVAEWTAMVDQDHHELTKVRQQITDVLAISDCDPETLLAHRLTLQMRDTQHQQALKQYHQTLTQAQQTGPALALAQHIYQTCLGDHQTATAAVTRSSTNLQDIEAQLFGLTGGQPYPTLQQTLLADRQVLARLLETAQGDHQAACNLTLQAQEGWAQTTTIRAAALTQLQTAERAWTAVLASAQWDEPTFFNAQTLPDKQLQWRNRLDTYRQECLRTQTQTEELQAQVGTRTTSPEQLAHLRQALLTAQNQRTQTQEERTQLKVWLQDAHNRCRAALDLNVECTALTNQEQTYQVLAQNLQGDRFQAYLLENLQHELVSRATAFLTNLTENRYALKIQEGDFYVEDHWNAGEARRVQTLSGGETFATSLCMALALSEKLSMGAELGSLFLDEGFGSLDTETLESVTQILESLRQQNRLIGIITHVQALGERLPAQVKVIKAPAGSRITLEML